VRHERFGGPHVLGFRQAELERSRASGAERGRGAAGRASIDDMRQHEPDAEAAGEASGDSNRSRRLRRGVDAADDSPSPRRFFRPS
jgi:hypothetical protein